MQFTIDKKQASVSVDGTTRTDVSIASLPAGVEAVRWYGDYGTVDYRSPDTPRTLRKRSIVDFADFQPVLDAFATPIDVVVAAKPTDQIIADFTSAIQQRLDDFARTHNYDNILSACTYATSTVPKFAIEGQYCINARDETWNTCYAILSDVKDGVRPMLSLDEIMSELPTLEWPQ